MKALALNPKARINQVKNEVERNQIRNQVKSKELFDIHQAF